MGIRGFTKNNKKSFKSQKSNKWQRQCKAEKKKVLPKEAIEIENIHLFSDAKLKNKLKNPKNNIKISGKKLRRLTKRLNHRLRENATMETEVVSQEIDSGDEDEVMQSTVTEQAGNSEPSTSGVKAPRKKRRGGKKHKNKKTANDSKGKADGDNQCEDAEMSE